MAFCLLHYLVTIHKLQRLKGGSKEKESESFMPNETGTSYICIKAAAMLIGLSVFSSTKHM